MKFVMFVGDLGAHGPALFNKLKEIGFSCAQVSNPDEVDQAGLQFGKAILIFCDHKLGYRFLMENTWTGFPMLNILFLPKPPVLNADVEKKLNSVHLNIYSAKDFLILLEKINKFIKSGDNDPSQDVEIEFSVTKDLGKKE